MRYKKQMLGLFLLGLGLTSYAQESVNSSGGDAMGAGGSVSYSIGQVTFTENSSSSGSVSQGVHKSFEILPVGVNETTLNISLSAFPNPTLDELTLKISNFSNEKLKYQVLDFSGKLIEEKNLVTNETVINMENQPVSTYLINVIQENITIQSFKIIKN